MLAGCWRVLGCAILLLASRAVAVAQQAAAESEASVEVSGGEVRPLVQPDAGLSFERQVRPL
ncbi:MAG: hypothetical protein ACKPJJ_31780, partial [Planctomycetaceae bacterium]